MKIKSELPDFGAHITNMEPLEKTCCLCMDAGELNLFEHKVIIEGTYDDSEDDIEDKSYELDAIDLLKIYQDMDLFNLTMELKLICQKCLEELTNCYKFYVRIKHISEQKQRLFEEAQQLDNLVVEALEAQEASESNIICADEKTLEESEKLLITRNITTKLLTPNDSSTPALIVDFSKEIDFGGQNLPVADMYEIAQYALEDEIKDSDSLSKDANMTDYEPLPNDENTIHQLIDENEETDNEGAKPSIQKRPRLKFLREKIARYNGPNKPPHENAAFVVTQFLPVKAQQDSKNQLLVNDFSNCKTSAQDMSTVEYAAVELKTSNFQHLDNGKLELGQNDHLCDDNTKKEVFYCQYCPNAFSAATYLIAHVRKSHVCKYCTKAFAKSLDLFVHIRQAHYKHKCAVCQKELSSQSNLRTHIKRVHGIRLPVQVSLLDYKQPNDYATIEF